MANDIGMIKSVQPAATHTGPGASVDLRGRAGADAAGRAVRVDEEKEPLENVVSDLNKLVRELHRELRFSVDEDSGDTVIKVIDRETDEVVRQIPSEELMRLRKRLEQAAGAIFQGSA